jgi:uncharacterized protein (DUF2062 family)
MKDEEKEWTYNRTGVQLEIEREGQEIFENMFVGAMAIGVIYGLIRMIF